MYINVHWKENEGKMFPQEDKYDMAGSAETQWDNDCDWHSTLEVSGLFKRNSRKTERLHPI